MTIAFALAGVWSMRQVLARGAEEFIRLNARAAATRLVGPCMEGTGAYWPAQLDASRHLVCREGIYHK
jgi:hypothetical protein